ncbi:MAG TPA: hypothetical protein VGG88_12510 [Gaiellaceae bacterium]
MNRRLRIGLGGIAALVIAGALVAPVVDRGGSSKACSMALSYRGAPYAVRPIRDNSLVQAISLGVGVVHGCGFQPQNVNIRSLLGVRPKDAVALEGDQSSIYVRTGVCPHASADALVACLKR